MDPRLHGDDKKKNGDDKKKNGDDKKKNGDDKRDALLYCSSPLTLGREL
jgi:hypothetical protein